MSKIKKVNKNNKVIIILVVVFENINIQDNNGRTSLTFACANGHLDVVGCLIHYGAYDNVRYSEKKNLIRLAAMNGHQNILHVLTMSEPGKNAKNYINAVKAMTL